MSILDKKYEKPEKRKKNIKLNDTKYQNVNQRRPRFYI